MRHPPRILIAGAALVLAGCVDNAERTATRLVGGDAARGRTAVLRLGCGSCHTIPGISGADALVGPDLDRIASRTYIAGVLTNTPDHMIRWVKDPPGVDALTAMPNLQIGDADARDIATFLYTLQ